MRVDFPSDYVSVVHRGGRRVWFVPHLEGPRASWREVVEVAHDPSRGRAVAESAQVTFRVPREGSGERVLHVSAPEFAAVEPDVLLDVRRPVSYVGQTNYVGTIIAPTEHWAWRPAWCESFTERANYLDLLTALEVRQLATQAFRFEWYFPSGVRVHVPDAVFLLEGGRRLLVDVSVQGRAERPEARAVFRLTAATCEAMGWDYQLRLGMPAQRVRNVYFLTCYRRLAPVRESEWRSVLRGMSLPAQVHQVATVMGGGDPRKGLGGVWWAMAQGLVHADLSAPLGPDALVLPGREGLVDHEWVVAP